MPVQQGEWACAACGAPADSLTVDPDGGHRRVAFTSVLTGAATPAVRAALGDTAALFALDPELVPWFCPTCDRPYCGRHWQTWDVFDADGFHDRVRGRCPGGHERMLED